MGRDRLTAFDVLVDRLSDVTLLSSINLLSLLVATDSTEAAIGIHGSLKCVTLPTKDIIAVLTVTGMVSSAEIERLGAIRWPLRLVIKLGSIPNDLLVRQYLKHYTKIGELHTSSMSCGILTGWVEGQSLVVRKAEGPDLG